MNSLYSKLVCISPFSSLQIKIGFLAKCSEVNPFFDKYCGIQRIPGSIKRYPPSCYNIFQDLTVMITKQETISSILSSEIKQSVPLKKCNIVWVQPFNQKCIFDFCGTPCKTLARDINVMTRWLYFLTRDMICDILKTHFRG